MRIEICDDGGSYHHRTVTNAKSAHLTIAFAFDFETTGERLTKKSSSNYVAVQLDVDIDDAVRLVYNELRAKKLTLPTLNIAGNSIRRMVDHGWSQEDVNFFITGVLVRLNKVWPIGKIVSGGQTGADIAGIVAAVAMGIESKCLMPTGFVQRDENGKDSTHTMEQIIEQIQKHVSALRKMMYNASSK